MFRTLTSESQVRQTLSSLTKLAAWACEAPISAIVVRLAERIETISSHGIALTGLPATWDLDAVGISRDSIFSSPDLRQHPYFSDQPLVIEAPKLRALLRVPVSSDNLPFLVSLAVTDVKARKEREWPTPRMRDMLEEIGSIIETEIRVAAEVARASDGDPATDPTLEELQDAVERASLPSFLLDEQNRLLLANAASAALFGLPRSAPGRGLEEFDIPGGDAIARLAHWSLAGAEPIADIAFALKREDDLAEAPTASISAFPLRVRGRDSLVMLIRARRRRAAGRHRPPRAAYFAADGPSGSD